MYRYVVVEYCFKDDSNFANRRDIGAYPTMKEARVEAGKYIKRNVKHMREKYRHWRVDVLVESVYYPIKD